MLMNQPKVTDFTKIEKLVSPSPGVDYFVLQILLDSGRKVAVGKFYNREDAESVELAIKQAMIEYRTKMNAWERALADFARTRQDDECPLCKSGTVEIVGNEVRCRGECGNVATRVAT